MSPLRIALIYAVAGTAWIVCSDWLLYGRSPVLMGSSSKGIGFVFTTAILIFLLTNRLRTKLENQMTAAVRNEAQFRQVVEKCPTGIVLQTGEHLRYMNPEAMKLFGVTDAGQVRRLEDMVHPDYREAVAARLRTASQEPNPPLQRIYLRADGTEFYAESSATPLAVDGEPGALVFIRDTSEERNRERWFQLLADAVPTLVWVADPAGFTTYLNDRWTEFTGIPPGEADGSRMVESLHPDDRERMAQAWRNALESGTALDVKVRFRRADGHYRWHMTRALPLRDHTGEIVNWFGASSDIHDSMRFKHHLDQALENERARIARELHDDLGHLLAVAKLAVESADRTPELERALDAVTASMVRTRDMAVLLRPPVIDRLGLFAAIEWQAGEFQRATGIPCDTYLPDGPEPLLSSERKIAAFRIVQEALTNVARHAGATEVAIEGEFEEPLLTLCVRDNGIGFDAANAVAPDKLGLLGMQERALLAGGTLTVEASPGGGSVVRLGLGAETRKAGAA